MVEVNHSGDAVQGLDGRVLLYEVLSKCFRQEPGSLVTTINLESGPRLSESAGLVESDVAPYLEMLHGAYVTDGQRNTTADYRRLFLPSGTAFVHPYESYYISQETFRQRPNSGRGTQIEVEFFYTHAGISLDKIYYERADHVGTELTFMEELIRQETKAWQNEQKSFATCCSQWQRQFLDGHLLRWLRGLCKVFESRASTDFYRVLARVTWNFVVRDAKVLSKNRD